MGKLLFFTILALSVSFVCSILEAVLLSITPAFVRAARDAGTKVGIRLHRLKRDVDKPLAAILSLNTIANTIGAAGVGAQAAIVFGNTYVGVISAILTLLILVFSEIIPKTLGALHWRRLAPVAAWILPVMIRILFPLVWLAMFITRRLSRNQKRVGVSREELAALTAIASTSDDFHARELKIFQSMLSASRLKAEDVMTPRTVVFALQQDQSVDASLLEHPNIPFSRIPVYSDQVDDIDGFVLKDDMLSWSATRKGTQPLSGLKREILTVPDFLPLLALFEQLVDNRSHIALVSDEHGGVEGVVTLEDVVETMLGLEIMDEADQVEDMRELARRLRERRRKWRDRIDRGREVFGSDKEKE